MKFLKQSTAAVIAFGPGLLPSDGVTLVTTLVSALDHASTGIFLCKNGAAAAIRHATVTATTYDAYGSYLVTLDTTDTNTLGRLRVMFAAAASCLPIWEDFTVLAANVYDSLIGASANLKIDLDTIKTQAVTAAAGVTVLASVGTAATSTAQTGDNFARQGAPAGLSIAADIAAIKVDTGGAIAELSQGQPPTNPTPQQALMLGYMALRNALTTTANSKNIANNAGTVICKQTLSDDGTTYTQAKLVTGP